MVKKTRLKLEERAFIGILIGYDTAARSWIFLDPKTGRTVNTIHATFYERARAPEEFIDMGHLVLQEPKWESNVKEHCWKCQLWPKVLWPGMNNSPLGHTSKSFPNVEVVKDALDPNSLEFDSKAHSKGQKSKDKQVKKDSKPKQESESDYSSAGDESLSDAETEQDTDLDIEIKLKSISNCDAQWSDGKNLHPNDLLQIGPKWSKSMEYQKKRCKIVAGKTISDLFEFKKGKIVKKGLIKVPGKIKDALYAHKDLQWDLQHGKLTVIISPQDDDKTNHEQVSSFLINHVLRSNYKSNPTKTVEPVNTLFFDKYTEVKHAHNQVTYDKLQYGTPASLPEATQIGSSEWGTDPTTRNIATVRLLLDDMTTLSFPQLDNNIHSHTFNHEKDYLFKDGKQVFGYEDYSNVFFTESREIDYDVDYGSMPSQSELLGYRGNGTYINDRGNIKSSHIVRRAKELQQQSINVIYAEGKRHALGVPSPSEMNQIDIPEPKGTQTTTQEESALKSHNSNWYSINSVQPFKHPLYVPKGTKKALYDPSYYPHWPEVIWKELSGLYDMGCMEYEKEDHPEVKHYGVLPSHMVFTDKWSADVPAQFSKCKARLVAGGNFEKAPEKAFENFSPTAGAVINRMYDAYCTYKGWKIYSTDCTQAFLNAKTTRPIFVRPPRGVGTPGYVWRLLKHLYGLCSSPAAWMDCLTDALKEYGFVPFDDDPCILRRKDEDGDEIIIEVFVDDIKWSGNNETKIMSVIADLHKNHFGITFDGEVKTYLGMLYNRTLDKDGKVILDVNQTAYIESMIDRFELKDVVKDYTTPLPVFHNEEGLKAAMGTDGALNRDEELKHWASKFTFPTIIGSLIHAMVHTRPDISYAVSVLSRSMAKPELYHFKAARRLLLYLRKTKHLGIRYSQAEMEKCNKLVTASTDELLTKGEDVSYDQYLEAAVDASFADCVESYRSTSGFIVWFGGSPVEWECKRQPLVTLSTMESEYVAASKCVSSIRFIHKLLEFLDLKRQGPTKVHEDNSACVAISTKPVHKSRSKHIGTKYHNVREASLNGEVELVQVWTEHQIADIFTKSLAFNDFDRCREVLMGRIPFDDMVESHPKPNKVGITRTYGLTYEDHFITDVIAKTTKKYSWPKRNVPLEINWNKVTPNCMSWRDSILGKPNYQCPGYAVT